MGPRNMVLVSVAFVIFGMVVLVIGVIMVLIANKFPADDSAGLAILRISGRIACISGGLLIAATICACLYLCIIGAPYTNVPDQFYAAPATSLTKVGKPRTRANVRPTTTVNKKHIYAVDEKYQSTNNVLQRNIQPRRCVPRGDIGEHEKESQLSEFPWKNRHNSLNLGYSGKPSNSASDFPRLSDRRRRHQSLDKADGRLPTIGGLPMSYGTGSSGNEISRRLWMPCLDGSNASAFRTSDSLSSQLFGSGMESTGGTLYCGRRAHLGGIQI
ncbi:hypothetical protein CSKR_106160 [Clonorchis sinensis]|uniref:Uncharacterized protein n=1 Tax=Clonorchis sinensis TaxID=79923 RepID=A0A8T1M7C6_CLOSI|nr:hypothetical protein CSKR_106160 [Clonorchis sinensis]